MKVIELFLYDTLVGEVIPDRIPVNKTEFDNVMKQLGYIRIFIINVETGKEITKWVKDDERKSE